MTPPNSTLLDKLARRWQLIGKLPHTATAIICLGLLLVAPSLLAGLFADDFTHLLLINYPDIVKQPHNLSLFHLFSFIDTDTERRLQLFGFSITPWWINNTFSLIFFRPLSEITHYIDYNFLNPHTWLMHLHSIAWYTLLLLGLKKYYQHFCKSTLISLLALLFFVCDSTHGFTIAWLANRNAIIAATFTIFALLTHHSFRTTLHYRYYLLSSLCIALSFLAAETGIAVGIFLFAYAICLDKDGALKGLLYLAPALIIFLIWFFIYKHYGYGAFGNHAYYIDPIESPALFLKNLPGKLSQVLAMQFNFLPLHLIKPMPRIMIACGIFYLTMIAIALLRRPSPQLCFHSLILLMAIIPITSSELQERNMMFVGIAGCALLANCVAYLYRQKKTASAAIAWAIIIFHIGLSGLLMLPTSFAPKWLAGTSISNARSLPDSINNHYVITFGVPMFDAVYTAAIRRSENLAMPKQLWNVTTQSKQLTITRTSTHRYIISNPDGLLAPPDFMLRNLHFDPIAINSSFDLNHLHIIITALNAFGTPTQATLQIDPEIPPESIQTFYWHNYQLQAFSLKPNETLSL